MLGSGTSGLLTGDRRSDRLSFCQQSSASQYRFSIALSASLRLCVGGRSFVSLCFRGCDGLRKNFCVFSVPLCLCGSLGVLGVLVVNSTCFPLAVGTQQPIRRQSPAERFRVRLRAREWEWERERERERAHRDPRVERAQPAEGHPTPRPAR